MLRAEKDKNWAYDGQNFIGVLLWGTFLQSLLDIICKASYTKNAKHALQKRRGTDEDAHPRATEEEKLSQEELAQIVGVTRQTITSLECGKYTASLVLAYKIARYFGLTIEEVFDFSEVEDMKDGSI